MISKKDEQEVRNHLETEFERSLFEATLTQISRTDDPLRANNFAYALRELSRHILARLAPDSEIKAAPWYVEHKEGKKVIITRPQRMQYAIQGHLEDDFLKDQLELDYRNIIIELKDQIGELSKFTHVNPDTFNVDEKRVKRLCRGAMGAFAEFCKSMFECREGTLKAISDQVDQTVVEHIVSEEIVGLYDFATHYSLEEVSIDNLRCTGFKDHEVYGFVEGSVDVTLLYGSSGDRERGDGMEAQGSATFSCEISFSLADLSDISIVEGTFEFDFEELENSFNGDHDEELY